MWAWQEHGFAPEPQVRAWAWLPEPCAEALSGTALAGLRFGVKDVMDVRGMPTQYGCAGMPADPRAWDCTVVAQLRAAGAQPIGKTVTAEFAFVHPGATRNPHNPAHTPGGSSSGSAAAVAAGMVDFALGTQTGGSIMRPASYCGVVGFKPSWGVLHRQSMMVTAESLDTIGWFTRDVALSARLLGVLTESAPAAARLPETVIPVHGWPALEPEMAAALEQATQRLRSHGVRLRTVADLPQRLERLAQLHQVVVRYELARGLLGVWQGGRQWLSASLREAVVQGLAIDTATYEAAQAERAQHAREMQALAVDGYTLLMAPSAQGPAPAGLASTGSSLPNRPWSLLGWPSIHLPTQLSAAGLPLGVQFIAPHAADRALHACAQAMHPLLLE